MAVVDSRVSPPPPPALPWLALAVGLALRVAGLWRPLWADEAFTWHWTRLPVAEWSWLWEIDFNPPLFYLLQRPFHLLEGLGVPGPAAARLLPLLLEAGFLWWAWGAIKRARLPHGALWLSLWAVAPAAVEAAGVGRGYTLLLWLAAVAWTALDALLANPLDRRARWWLAGALALALLTHYYAFFLLAALALRAARAGQARRLLPWLGPGLVPFLAWAPAFWIQLSRGNEMIQPLLPARVARGLASLLSGQVVFLESPGLGARALGVLALTAALGGVLALVGWRALGRQGGRLCWEALCLPLFALAVSVTGLQVWEEYWLLPALPALLWLAVAGVAAVRPALRRPAALGLFAGLLLASVRVPAYVHQDWEGAVAWVWEQGGRGHEMVANIPFDVEALAEAEANLLGEGPGESAQRARQSRQARAWLAGGAGMAPPRAAQLCRRLTPSRRIYLVGSYDPEPLGGMLAALDGCGLLERRGEWRGRRVFVVAYGARGGAGGG